MGRVPAIPKLFGPSTSRFAQSLSVCLFAIGLLCIFLQIAVIICATNLRGIIAYVWARQSFTPAKDPTDLTAARVIYYRTNWDMAVASMGFFAGLCYMAIGVFGKRWSYAIRIGTPAAIAAQHSTAHRVFRVLCAIGIPLSILLLIFSVYLAYMMSHWYHRNNTYTFYLGTVSLVPAPLHALHAALSLMALLFCLRGVLAEPGVIHVPQQTTATTYRVQQVTTQPEPEEQTYVIQQQTFTQPDHHPYASPQSYYNGQYGQSYPAEEIVYRSNERSCDL
ncbi:hypothetical protein BV898_12153 [Hypsibius exemplaris]|uniref:Uncharacterized protein n=1 Tax=Hypsibius exemplaris TaxID=2072580 RepID=A0A1W0WEH9_HYPEX|nr:hypothetical protein BV898_12153 [Hypsibius exemplaris]